MNTLNPQAPCFTPTHTHHLHECSHAQTPSRLHSNTECLNAHHSNILHKHSSRYPFAKPNPDIIDPPPPTPIPSKPISLNDILKNPLLSNVKKAPSWIRSRLHNLHNHECLNPSTSIHTAGRSAHQANRELRKILLFDLRNHHDRTAFSSTLPSEDIPRADDLEDLMYSFPGIDDLDYSDPPPPCPFNELDTKEWQRLHSTHCRATPRCTPTSISDNCYFKPLYYMLHRGFQASLAPGRSIADIRPHSPAYIHLWNKDEVRCARAFEKLLRSTHLEPIDNPPLVFPLLPVYKGKQLWRLEKFGTDFTPRLAEDITTSGGNEIFADWKIRYLALFAICSIISRGDFLATRDITGFFNRLPAGELLRRLQCFQDPRSYEKTSRTNNEKVKSGQASFLQQQSCMFGHKQLPAWASCVSSELARILHENCIRVAGVLIDDFLFHGPKELGKEKFAQQLKEADTIMTKLGVPPNDKGQEPTQTPTFSGIVINTQAGFMDVEEEQRQYCIQRLEELLNAQSCKTKDMTSLNGSLGWLCVVIHAGRCRRDVIQKAADSDSTVINITATLRKQLRWWWKTLSSKNYRPSPIWFRDEHQETVLIQSDASGDAGFGFCAAGLHVTGRWSPSIHDLIRHDMFVKETLPTTIAILLLHHLLHNHIFCNACDNSGVVFRLNCGSCRNPLGRILIQNASDALASSNSHLLADWNNREQPLAVHADDISKIISEKEWQQLQPPNQPPWIFNLFIHDIRTNECVSADIRIPRLSEALPNHLRHLGPRPPAHQVAPILAHTFTQRAETS